MRVGVYFHDLVPSSGGAHTFQSSILKAIKFSKCRHSFFLFCVGKASKIYDSTVPWIDLDEKYLNDQVENKSNRFREESTVQIISKCFLQMD